VNGVPIQVPATVQAVLAARIDRLPAAAKDLLQTAAVIGKECPLALLQAVTAQPEETLRHGIAQLQAAEFFYETSQFPEVHYAFAHALTHEVAYHSLLQERRRALHARTLEAIEALYAERLAEWTDQLAHHVVRGEVWSKAASYFRQSRLSLSTSMDDSFWWLGEHAQALELSQNELAVAATFKNFSLQVTTHFYLGQAHHALGNYAQAIEYLRHNVALAGDLRRERFYLPGLASVLSLTWLASCLSERGEFSEGRALAEEAVQIAASAEHIYSRSLACLGLGSLSLQQGALSQAMTILQRGLLCSQGDNLQELYPLLAAPLGAAYALSGQLDEALPLLQQAVEQATARKFMGLQAGRVAWLSAAHLLADHRDEALTLAQRALDLARLHKERGHEAWILRLMGDIALHREVPEVESAPVAYRQALALAEELGMRPLQAHCHRGLGTLYGQTGEPEHARVELSTALDLYRGMEMMFWVPQVENALADVKRR
jgi:predicted ATPase